MKSLKDLLLSGMFVVMTAALLVACGGGDEAPADGSGDGAVVVAPDAGEGSDSSGGALETLVKDGTATIDAAKEIKEDAEDDGWYPDDVIPSGSAANQ